MHPRCMSPCGLCTLPVRPFATAVVGVDVPFVGPWGRRIASVSMSVSRPCVGSVAFGHGGVRASVLVYCCYDSIILAIVLPTCSHSATTAPLSRAALLCKGVFENRIVVLPTRRSRALPSAQRRDWRCFESKLKQRVHPREVDSRGARPVARLLPLTSGTL